MIFGPKLQAVIPSTVLTTICFLVKSKDSLNFEYTLAQDNGYFDGERRKIPVVEAGVKETKGYFSALLRDTAVNYAFDKNLVSDEVIQTVNLKYVNDYKVTDDLNILLKGLKNN